MLTADRGTSSLAQGCTGAHVLVEIEKYLGELPPCGRTNQLGLQTRREDVDRPHPPGNTRAMGLRDMYVRRLEQKWEYFSRIQNARRADALAASSSPTIP